MARNPAAVQRMLKQAYRQKPVLLGSIADAIHSSNARSYFLLRRVAKVLMNLVPHP